MKFWEKWYWATYIRGENPILSFIGGLIKGFWIPIVVSAIFCLLTDPQFKSHSLNQFDVGAYVAYYCYFWKVVFYAIYKHTVGYLVYAWQHWDEVVNFVRRVLWLD
jgi:hypothetical protein